VYVRGAGDGEEDVVVDSFKRLSGARLPGQSEMASCHRLLTSGAILTPTKTPKTTTFYSTVAHEERQIIVHNEIMKNVSPS
jgi:hypothetical protein